VVGLELGGRRLLSKAVQPQGIAGRASAAVLRRHENGPRGACPRPGEGRNRFNGGSLECRTRRLINPDGRAGLADQKANMPCCSRFSNRHNGRSRGEMLLQATRVREDIFDRSIDVQVLRLRRKLEIDPNAPRVIETERGVGYIFTAIVKPF